MKICFLPCRQGFPILFIGFLSFKGMSIMYIFKKYYNGLGKKGATFLLSTNR